MSLKNRDNKTQNEYDTVKGKIKRCVFTSQENDFCIYIVNGKEKGKSTFSLSSSAPPHLHEGDEFVAYGTWGEYKGKPSFKAKVLTESIAMEAKGIYAWLKTQKIEGVGKVSIDKLVQTHGKNLPMLMDDPEKLAEGGIALAKAEAISQAWKDNQAQAELIGYLGEFNLGPKQIINIIERFGTSTKEIINYNPWRLASDVDGIGFTTADRIATASGKERDCFERITAGLNYVMQEKVSQNGHCGLTRRVLIGGAASLLGLRTQLVEENLEQTLQDPLGGLIEEPNLGLIYSWHLSIAEERLADQLLQRCDMGSPLNITRHEAQELVQKAQNELTIKLDEHQKQAVVESLCNATSIVTGGPGTGKSTIMRVLAHALYMKNCTVALCAPTGKAAKRLTEATGRKAKTIHRLLEWSARKQGFIRCREKPIEADWLIIDEYSMVGLRLAQQKFDAVPDNCGVTLVGDTEQLASVDAGNVLSDIMNSGTLPITRLLKTHRTGKGSGIAMAAAHINKGELPLKEGETSHNGFHLEFSKKSDSILQRTMDLILYDLPMQGFDPMQDVQILTSMKKGTLGVDNMNSILKSILNPYKDDEKSINLKDVGYTIGDRVMHLRNDYIKGVFNGENGTVTDITTTKSLRNPDKELPALCVDYGHKTALYTKEDIEDVMHSWSVTVHKSQGSEFPAVIFLYSPDHRIMLNRSIAYTALTRAKSKAWMIGTDQSLLNHIVNKKNEVVRYTGLSKRLNNNIILPHIEHEKKIKEQAKQKEINRDNTKEHTPNVLFNPFGMTN